MSDLPPVPKKHCRWCGQPCPGKRRNWCSQKCVDEYLVVSSASHVAREIKKRDKGVCALCGTDTQKIRREMLRQRRMGIPVKLNTRRLWEAHHVLPVCQGGGCCGLDNYRTLCTECHLKETKKLAALRAQQRRQNAVPKTDVPDVQL